MPNLSEIRHKRELQFAKTFFDHDEWEFQPGPFPLSNGTRYTPDFLDKRRGVLIEVVGSRQAYHHNKGKYQIFIDEYPQEVLELRTEEGKQITPKKGRLFCQERTASTNKTSEQVKKESKKILDAHIESYRKMSGIDALKRHFELLELSMSDVVRVTGISQPAISMTFGSGKRKRGIGVQTAMIYHEAFGIPLDVILNQQK